jgi:hypothetical protein
LIGLSKGTDGENVHLAAADVVWQCNALDAFATLHGDLRKEDVDGEGLLPSGYITISHLFDDDIIGQQWCVAAVKRPITETQLEGLRRAIGIGDCAGAGGLPLCRRAEKPDGLGGSWSIHGDRLPAHSNIIRSRRCDLRPVKNEVANSDRHTGRQAST